VEDLFSFGDELLMDSTPTISKPLTTTTSTVDDDFGGFKTADDDDEFDDFQSPAPIQSPPSNTFNTIPSIRTLPASSTATFASPQPVSGQQTIGLNDLVGYTSASPAPSMSSQTSMSIKPMTTTTTYHLAQPNYFTSVPIAPSSSSTLSPTNQTTTPLGKSNTGSSLGSGPKKSGDAFGSLWSTASMQAGIKKPATPTAPQASMAAMAKEKASAGIWGAGSSSATNNNSSIGKQGGNGLDDLLM